MQIFTFDILAQMLIKSSLMLPFCRGVSGIDCNTKSNFDRKEGEIAINYIAFQFADLILHYRLFHGEHHYLPNKHRYVWWAFSTSTLSSAEIHFQFVQRVLLSASLCNYGRIFL